SSGTRSAEPHSRELVWREAVGAAIPLAGVGCAIARTPLAKLAALQDGTPFAGSSMTEDYEVGLRIGALGLKSLFVRLPARPGERGIVASRGHFPATLGSAVRQKARWLGGIALGGWERGAPRAGRRWGRDRARRLGPARLERRAWRAVDADARPARATRRVAPARGLCGGLPV